MAGRAIRNPNQTESVVTDAGEGISWSAHNRRPSILKQATELYEQGLTVRQVAGTLRISKTEAGRLRLRASDTGLLSSAVVEKPAMNGRRSTSMEARIIE